MVEQFHPSAKAGIFKSILGAAILTLIMLSQQQTIDLIARPFYTEWFSVSLMAVWGLAVLLILLSLMLPFFKTIDMGEGNIKVMSGILNVHSVVIPYDRITDVQSTRTVLQRLVGLGNIMVNTAGENTGIIMLENLTNDHVTSIMQMLEERRHPKVAP